MAELKTEVKKWGNSLGLVIPKDLAKKEGLKPNQKITVLLIKRTNVLKETFGTLKKWKKPTQQIMDETDKELYDG